MKKITYPKLPPKFKTKWLKALRSGEYEQTTGSLCDNGAYCCIGIAGKVQGISDKVLHNNGLFNADYFSNNLDRIKKVIPNALIGTVSNNSLLERLVDMNDGPGSLKKRSFKQIANWIERNL